MIGKFASAYNPKAYTDWKKEAAALFEASGIRVGDKPVEVLMEFSVTKPKTSKLLFPKPDIDNFTKAALDAATQAGVWDDDTQVFKLTVEKQWTPREDREGILFIVLTDTKYL